MCETVRGRKEGILKHAGLEKPLQLKPELFSEFVLVKLKEKQYWITIISLCNERKHDNSLRGLNFCWFWCLWEMSWSSHKESTFNHNFTEHIVAIHTAMLIYSFLILTLIRVRKKDARSVKQPIPGI